ncbi:hypothetical protein TU77_16225 [Pseudomonas synxantha]|nr:hypothetical protein TU77_16225 [Pseudomonas synxantha]OEC72997.1 hypothetical protein A7D21_27880 [Pseudomonas sp. AP19]
MGQDTDSTGLDLEGYSCVIFAVLPLVAYRTTFDQHPHAFLIQRAPVFGLSMPELNRGPIAASIFIVALPWYGVVEVHIQP